MLQFRTILHPTDFSARAKNAFDLACSLAVDYGAWLVVVHVKPPRMTGGEVHASITTPEVLDRGLQGYLGTLTGFRRNEHPEIPSLTRRRISEEWRRSFEEWGYSP